MGNATGTGPTVHLAHHLYAGMETLKGSKRNFSISRRIKFVSMYVTFHENSLHRRREISLFRGFAGIILVSPMTSVLGIAEINKIPLISSDIHS